MTPCSRWVAPDVLEECIASIFRVGELVQQTSEQAGGKQNARQSEDQYIYREQGVRLSSYWFVLRQNETVNTRGLNHRTNRKTRWDCGALKRAVLAGSEHPSNIEESWLSIRVLGPEKGHMLIWGGRRKKCKSWEGRKHWVWGNKPGHQERQVGEELRGLSGNPEPPSVWRGFLRSFRE
jgi:hypothetical protein